MLNPSALKSPLRWLVLGIVLVTACGGGDSLLLPSEGEPSIIQVVRGDGQSGRVGEALSRPVVVRVTDRAGSRVEGATVAFVLTPAAPNSVIRPDTATTDANGEASAEISLGTTIGQQNGEARLVTAGGFSQKAAFMATAVSETANSMAPVGGEDQAGHVGEPLDDRLVVQVTDAFGNPISGVPINWEAEGGGTVSAPTVNTDAQGRASVERILGPATGVQSTVATSQGLAGSPATFIHTALAGDGSILSIVSGDNQTGRAGTQLSAELVVELIDAEGNGVPNTAVAWVVATGGGSVTPATSNTDQDGRAAARWTLGGSPGANRLDAVVSGVGVASFDAIATTGTPAALSIVTQPSASARNGVSFGRQPVIQVRDASGNPVARSGIPVLAAIGAGSGNLTGTRQRLTDGNGRATFTDLAIVGGGRYTLVFSSSGYASATSSDINVEGVPTTTTITKDTPDPSIAGSTVTVEFRVSSDGATPPGSVTVTALDGGATCSGGLSAGAGSCQMNLNLAGNRTLRAEYSGAPGFNPSADTEGHRVDPAGPGNRAPHADYNWHCEGLSCQFTDASSDPDGTIAGRSWNFGDGSAPVQDQNPLHNYTTSGNYTVVLTVSDDKGATDESSAKVKVDGPPPPPQNKAPHAEFEVQCANLSCSFTDRSTDDDGNIAGWHWVFGDGQESTDPNPSHSYASPGKYQATLTVTDNAGASDTKQHEAEAKAPAPASTTVTITGFDPEPSEFGASVTVSFTVTSPAGTPSGDVTITDPRGGGCTGSAPSGSCSYSPVGDGTRKVRATYAGNSTFSGDTDERDHTVKPQPPPPNQPPVAGGDGPYTTAEDTPLNGNLLTNDSDPEGGPLTAELVSGAAHGNVAVQSNGTFNYTPAADYSGGDSFTYRARDNQGAPSSNVTVNISITPVNDPPVAANDAGFTTQQDVPLLISAGSLLANDVDPDGDPLSVINPSQPQHGTLSPSGDGFLYTPETGYPGPDDSFTYQASDGIVASASATVTITVTPAPPPAGSP